MDFKYLKIHSLLLGVVVLSIQLITKMKDFFQWLDTKGFIY
ncbi:hypothetical protein MuYL_4272 [Mucilaginibacter xinganensis]|uniref:Uncharacterized protein n=1 Tax=Mucilaginibacter xinganensis TaxID=1234841 RepID=A0A223P233_9SPHI|nr:hypothetical protein MuYL_4272 [Mucilaginibacter xinganensis]